MSVVPHAPVDEVVLSVAFGHKESLTGPWLGVTLGPWLERYPKIDRKPPYEMPIEHPPGMRIPTGGGIRLEMLQGGLPNVRFWLSASDETQLLQVQPNYFALNWRRRTEDQKYPGYVALRDQFFGLLNELIDAVYLRGDGELGMRQVELTYIDILRPNDLWKGHSEAHKVVKVDVGGMGTYEQFGLTYSSALQDEDGRFLGRMHTNIQPAVKIDDGAPVINMSMSARSSVIDRADVSVEDIRVFLDMAHDRVTETFYSITTSDAREAWGLS